MKLRIWCLLGLVVTLASIIPSEAQEYRGNVFVEVTKEDGTPVPGAKVTLGGADFSRTQTADAEGKARFVRLDPGSYTLTSEAEGFAKSTLDGIQVSTSANVSMKVTMIAGSKLEESIVVTAVTPLLDQRKTGAGTVLTQAELSEIPTARDPWAVLSTVPGVTTDRVNVGGNESGQQSNFVGHGDDGTNTSWVMDGVEFTDIGAAGSSATYLDFNSFDEIGISTSGSDVEQTSGGLHLNFTTKQGANTLKGNARFWYTDIGLQSSTAGQSQPGNVDATANPLPNNQINEVFEKNFDIGGPFWKDHIWYWFGFSQNDVDNIIATGHDKTKLQNESAKIHGQIANTVNWKAFYTSGNKSKDGRGLATTRPPETTWNQEGPTPIYTGYVDYQITPNFDLAIQYGHVGGKFSLTPKGGLDTQIINDANNVWHGSYVLYDTSRPSDQYTFKGNNYFSTGSWEHEVKYGFRYKKSTVESLSKWSNSDFFVYSGAYIYLYRERNLSVDVDNKNAFVSWTALHGPWAITGGLSYTDQSGKNNPTLFKDDGLCPTCLPGQNYPGSPSAYTWKDVSPRLGATYTFDMQKRLLLRANYAQYVDGLGASDITYNSPAAAYAYITIPWTDANANGHVDPGEFSTNPCLDGVATNFSVDPCDPNGFFDKIDPNYKAPRVKEVILGGEYELAKDFTIGLNAIWRERDRERWYDGNLDGRPVASSGPLYDVGIYNSTGQLVPLAPTDYDLTTTLTGTFPDGTPYAEPFYDLNASGLAKTTNARPSFLTNRPGYTTNFKGLEFTATKRLSKKWMLRGFASWNKWTQHFSANEGIADPTNFEGGTTAQNADISIPSVGSGTKDGVWLGTSQWQFNVNGVYELPYGMALSGNLYGRQGYGIPYIDRSGPKDVQIGGITDRRYDDLYTLDLKFSKLFKLSGSTIVELSGEVFNALDAQTVLSRKVRVDQGTNVDAITENLSPRILRFGASVSF